MSFGVLAVVIAIVELFNVLTAFEVVGKVVFGVLVVGGALVEAVVVGVVVVVLVVVLVEVVGVVVVVVVGVVVGTVIQ